MSSINNVVVSGHVGQDPSIHNGQNQSGKEYKIANFSIAVTERWNVNGEQKSKTIWINASSKFAGLSGIIERFVKKGSYVVVAGKLEENKYTNKHGHEVTTLILNVKDIEFKSDKQENNNQGQSYQPQTQAPPSAADIQNELEDEVPF